MNFLKCPYYPSLQRTKKRKPNCILFDNTTSRFSISFLSVKRIAACSFHQTRRRRISPSPDQARLHRIKHAFAGSTPKLSVFQFDTSQVSIEVGLEANSKL